MQPLARPQARETRRERPFGDDHAVELEHRIFRRVDEGERTSDERARLPLLLRQRDPHELPGLEGEARRLHAQREERGRPRAILQNFSVEPVHWIRYGSSCRSASSPPSMTIAPWRRLLPVSENSKV